MNLGIWKPEASLDLKSYILYFKSESFSPGQHKEDLSKESWGWCEEIIEILDRPRVFPRAAFTSR